MARFSSKVVLVTGGGDGIGRATCLAFAREDAAVAIFDVRPEPAEAVADECRTLGARARAWRVDVSKAAEVDRAVSEVVETFGRIDVLVNNAGITRDAQLVKAKDGETLGRMSDEDFDLVMAVNLKGVFNCTRAVAPVMIRQGSGVILSASSVVGLDGNFGQTNYVATKAGVVGMTKVWARELGRFGIRVNAVAPGFILTSMTAKMPEKVLEAMKARTPLGRLGTPEDVARAYLWLASDDASYVHGAVLRVDGGIVVGT